MKNYHSDPMTLPIILEADELSAQDRKDEESRLARKSNSSKSKKRKGEGENKSPKPKSAEEKTPSARKRNDRDEKSISLERKNHSKEDGNLSSSKQVKGRRKITSPITNRNDEGEKLSPSERNLERKITSPTDERDDEGGKLTSSERGKRRNDEVEKSTSSDRDEGGNNDNVKTNSSFQITSEDGDEHSDASSVSKDERPFVTPTDVSSEDPVQQEEYGENTLWNKTKVALRRNNPVKFVKLCVARWTRRQNKYLEHQVTTEDGWTEIKRRFPTEHALAIMDAYG